MKPQNAPTGSRLATFIRENNEKILLEWEEFARSLPAASNMDIEGLRDHAKKMLDVIADDLDQPQTNKQQSEKAAGQADANDRETTAAQEHGTGRAESGFSVEQMVAEFRALRASVMRLWYDGVDAVTTLDIGDVIRFNEAIDQAIAESIARFSAEVGESKERFLAILGHDLRTPLSAIITSSAFMLDTGQLKEPNLALVKGMESSARRMSKMVEDLLDFTRTRFGDTMPIVRHTTDLGQVIHDVVTEVGASYPSSVIQSEISGDLRGEWDGGRLTQALTNLLSNAVQHGSEKSPIRVAAHGNTGEVVVTVQNYGPVIPKPDRDAIFSALKRGGRSGTSKDRRHLGLGLYIVQQIVSAHGGSIAVESTHERGTVFTVRLPRDA